MPEKIYSWDGIRDDLKRIHAHNPDFLPNTVLVGGAACWYYRLALTRAADVDFQVPNYTPSEEDVWLSKDLDFMGESKDEISELIGQPCPAMGALTEYAGATLDFIEEGLKMTREAANRTARRAEIDELTFYLASPSLLFAEKHARTLQKNRPQDALHQEVLARFVKMELCRTLERPEAFDTKEWLSEAKEVKTADLHFFDHDPALRRRLHTSSRGLGPEHRAIAHWIQHHVPSLSLRDLV